MMFGLAYLSKASYEFSESDLIELAEKASARNHLVDVTGYLHYKRGNFFQFLEGEKNVVLNLMDKIRQDERHKILNVVHLEDNNQRLFVEWRMKYLSKHDVNELQLDDVLEAVLMVMVQPTFSEERIKLSVTKLIKSIAARRKLPHLQQ